MPAVWPSEQGEAHLIPTSLMREQSLAQVQINQLSQYMMLPPVQPMYSGLLLKHGHQETLH